jgi:cyanophycinase-like exopeptidase
MTLLVLMGSGETAPSMVGIHRDVIGRTPSGPMLMLDTPFGFQDNADDLTARTRKYFRESAGANVDVARWRRSDDPQSVQDATLAQIASAQWLFAGPGSPTYALTQWAQTPIPGAIQDVLQRGGTVVLGSAAAVTAGEFALPVYEIYKVGSDPFWAAGLDLLERATNIRAAVIPHFDNAEGGTYDTRFCYLGERRLTVLERELPEDVAVLGVDEHTAIIFDLDAGQVEVVGTGGLTVRRAGRSTVVSAGSTLGVSELRSLVRNASVPTASATGRIARASDEDTESPIGQPSLDADVARHRAAFDYGMVSKDVDSCISAILGLEAAIHDWSADTLQSDSADRGRRELRAMVVRLGELARVGTLDPRERLAPLVEALLELRSRARDNQDFATGDVIRERLLASGIEVRDTPDGSAWKLATVDASQ